jgi:hypothetical protein
MAFYCDITAFNTVFALDTSFIEYLSSVNEGLHFPGMNGSLAWYHPHGSSEHGRVVFKAPEKATTMTVLISEDADWRISPQSVITKICEIFICWIYLYHMLVCNYLCNTHHPPPVPSPYGAWTKVGWEQFIQTMPCLDSLQKYGILHVLWHQLTPSILEIRVKSKCTYHNCPANYLCNAEFW